MRLQEWNEIFFPKYRKFKKTIAVSQSCETVGVYISKKEFTQRTCSSQPFLKPTISIGKVIEGCKSVLCHHSSKNNALQLTHTSSLYESKHILRGLAVDPSRVKQLIKLSALRNDVSGQCDRGRLKNAKDVSLSQQVKQSNMFAGQIRNSDWQAIIKSGVNITLDPKTANPSLRPSKDRRRVRSFNFEESKENQHAWSQRAHHKYDGWFCILGAQGFSSGQHYWEVGVGGCCDWRIGVVKESAPKTGFTKLTTSTGYWTLRLQLGSLVALTDPVTKLNQSSPTRVGVYLDMEGKQVSFFDVQKKKRRHIYTFHADFCNSEKIYPVFGTVDTERELVIF